MTCSVERNNKGKITSVKDSSGKESTLYSKISKNIFINSLETSLDIYKNIFSKNFPIKSDIKRDKSTHYENGEPRLFYKYGNTLTEDLEDVILDDVQSFEIGFNDGKNFFTVGKLEIPRDKNNITSFLAEQVRRKHIGAEALHQGGELYLQGYGSSLDVKLESSRLFQKEVALQYGISKVTRNSKGHLQLHLTDGVVPLVKDGKVEIVEEQHLLTAMSKKKYDNEKYLKVAEFFRNEVTEEDILFTTSKNTKVDKGSLSKGVMSFIRNLGFSVTTLEDYNNKYKNRHGKDNEVNSLIDLAKKVIAVGSSENITDEFLEEVAHLAVSHYKDSNKLLSILSIVDSTQEYREYSEYYRTKYRSQAKNDVELENMVREEILGKVIQKELMNNFKESSLTATLYNSVLDIWNYFKDFLTPKVKKYHKKQVEEFSKQLTKDIAEGSTQNYDVTKKSDKVFYNATSHSLEEHYNTVEALKKSLLSYIGLESSADVLGVKYLESVDNANSVQQITKLVDAVSNELEVLEKNLNNLKKKGEKIDNDLHNKVLVLQSDIIPLLDSINEDIDSSIDRIKEDRRNLLKDKIKDNESKGLSTSDLIGEESRLDTKFEAIKQGIVSEIDSINKKFSPLKSFANKSQRTRLIDIANKVLGKYNSDSSDKEKDSFRDSLTEVQDDVNLFSVFLGKASDSNNKLIRLLASKIATMYANVNLDVTQKLSPIVKNMYSKGMEKFQKTIIKNIDGQQTHYNLSPINEAKYFEDLKQQKISIVEKLNINNKKEVIEHIEKGTDNVIATLINDIDFIQYKEELSKWESSKRELFFNEEYYKEKEDKLEKAGVSKYFVKRNGEFTKAKYEIIEKIRDVKTGSVDFSKLDELDKQGLQRVYTSYRLAKSPIDNKSGEVKEGLKITKVDGKNIIELAQGYTKETLPEDSRYVYDWYNYSKLANYKDSKLKDEFFTALSKVKEQDAIEWVEDNGGFSLNETYFNSVAEMSYIDSVKEYINNTQDPNTKKLAELNLEEYISLSTSRNGILQHYKKRGDLFDIESESMNKGTQELVRELDVKIRNIKQEIQLPKEYIKEPTVKSKREVSQGFYMLQKESGLNVVNFAKSHMVDTSKYESFERNYYNFELNNLNINFSKRQREFLKSVYLSEEYQNKSKDEQYQYVLEEYAKTQLPSYFTIYKVEGYDTFQKDIKEGKVKLEDVLSNKENYTGQYEVLNYIDVTPDYSWLDVAGDSYINPNRKNQKYNLQLKFSEYKDTEFFDKFGINPQEYIDSKTGNLDSLTPTKNKTEYDFLREMVKLRTNINDIYKDSSTVSPYLRVQLSETAFEKVRKVAKLDLDKESALDIVKDIAVNKVDELEYGDLASETTGAKIIPKYYQHKIDKPQVITDNSIWAIATAYKQALLYQARKESIGDVLTIQKGVNNQKFKESNGIGNRLRTTKGEKSRASKQTEEYINAHMYGINQNYRSQVTVAGTTYDLTPAIQSVISMTRNVGLKYNPNVAVTSYFTGKLKILAESVVNEYNSRDSYAKAQSKMPVLIAEYLKETGNTVKESELNKITEFFDIFDVEDRLKESGTNKTARILSKSGFGMDKLANLGVTPLAALATLYDYRMVVDNNGNNRFMRWRDFYEVQLNKNPNITLNEITKKWKNETDYFYNYLDFSKDTLTYNDSFEKEYGASSQEAFREIQGILVPLVKKQIANIDGQLSTEDRVAAQRNLYTNFLLMYRGFLVNLIGRKFKTRGFNYVTGQVEEGEYITLFNKSTQLLKEIMKQESFEEMIKLKKHWENVKEESIIEQQINMKRTLREGGIAAAVIFLFTVVRASRDDGDEDDSWVEDFLFLNLARVTAENNSETILGTKGLMYETLNSPFVGLDNYKAMLEPWEIKKNFEKNNLIGRRYKQYSDLKKTTSNYLKYNGDAITYLKEKPEK